MTNVIDFKTGKSTEKPIQVSANDLTKAIESALAIAFFPALTEAVSIVREQERVNRYKLVTWLVPLAASIGFIVSRFV